jgi:CheY-like chemotaxis protein
VTGSAVAGLSGYSGAHRFLDDQQEIRQLVSEILLEAGYEIMLAGSGVEGIDSFARSGPNLFLAKPT